MVKKPIPAVGKLTNRQVIAARAWLGFSQTDLAELSGVTRRAIQDFENGKREPQARTLRDIRNALEKSGVEFLFNGDRAVGNPPEGS
jgi:transcriptional regulator with XRE-family HTH domain